jgi:membrane protease YdiL (CAAX protease family)
VLTTTSRPDTAAAPSSARGRHLAVLLVAAFTGPWLVWGSALAQAHGLIGWRLPQAVALWTLTPSLLLALLFVGGRVAVLDLAGRLVRLRGATRWALLGLATPIVLATAAAGTVALLGGPTQIGHLMGLPAALLYLVYGTGLFLLTEEAVWRGALLPRLQARLAPLTANLVLGGVWAIWHLPLLFVPGAGDEGLPLLPFAALVVGTAVLIGSLSNAAGGSVLVAAVFHAAFDDAYSYAGVIGTRHVVLWAAAGLTTAAAAAVAVRTRGRLGPPTSSPPSKGDPS